MDSTILPALSYLECNCCISEEIWSLLKLYPYQIRYCLYSRWKNETYAVCPELLRKEQTLKTDQEYHETCQQRECETSWEANWKTNSLLTRIPFRLCFAADTSL